MLQPGTELDGRYVIEAVIGKGGMGAVYRARQRALADRAVAIKEMRFDVRDPIFKEAAERFRKEAHILGQLDHPGLVTVLDYLEVDDSRFLVMAYIEGHSLKQMMPLPVPQMLTYMLQVCDALEYLHGRNVVFRDLKPANIMIDSMGRVRLVDFGIAKVVDPAGGPTTTFIRGVGTPGYSPVEQFGHGTTDPRSDIYSLGATMYVLLTGKLPPVSVDLMSGDKKLPPLPPDVPSAVSAVILKCMALHREERYQDVRHVREALAALSLGDAHPTVPVLTAPPSPPRRSGLMTAAMVAVAFAVGMVVPRPEMEAAVVPAEVRLKDGSELLLVPAGSFLMGNNDTDADADEKEPHRLTLKAYYIGRLEVSNQQFRRFVKEVNYVAQGSWQAYEEKFGPNAPVVGVTFDDANAYCRWAEGRLPTEAEWEKAARGSDGRRWPWGNSFAADRCRSSVGTAVEGPVDVTSFPTGASPYGCLNMAGNAWEWCSSRLEPYLYKVGDDRDVLVGDSRRVVRGGCWKNTQPHHLSTSDRFEVEVRPSGPGRLPPGAQRKIKGDPPQRIPKG